MDGPGLTCLYRDGMSHDFESEEVEQAIADGWLDHPSVVKAPRKGRPKKTDDPEI